MAAATEMDTSSHITKRRKLNTPELDVKEEEEDEEGVLLPPQRRLITQGSKRYAPLPENCQKGAPGHKTNRAAWSKREMDKLKEGGLVAVRMFVREDGMVIDWTSSRPVWSDTLEPADPSTLGNIIEMTYATELAYTADAQKQKHNMNSKRKKRKDPSIAETPAELGSLSRPPVIPAGRRSPVQDMDLYIGEGHVLGEDVTAEQRHKELANAHLENASMSHVNVDPPRASSHERTSESGRLITMEDDEEVTKDADDDGEVEELQSAALDFLRKYIKRFDGDRHELAEAYSEDAVFSYRLEKVKGGGIPLDLMEFAPMILSDDSSTGVSQGPQQIIRALQMFSNTYKFCTPEHAEMEYDVSCLEGGVILLIAYSKMRSTGVGTGERERLAVNQSFVLRKREEGVLLGSGDEDIWPLVAVSHQMAIRVIASPELVGERMES